MTQTAYIPFAGGLDQVSSPYLLSPGSAIDAENFEIAPLGGYARIAGFERYDGRPEPHLAAPSAGGTTPLTVAQATAAAANTRRALITSVPGSGPVRGVVVFNDEVYAFRNNATNTECVLHKASATGWQVVTTPTLAPGGMYQFAIWNFGGTSPARKLFGCDGVNKAFSFDGTTYTEITTGMSPDTPSLIAAHKNHLFLAFGASLQHSAIGNPATWTPALGAAELAMGDTITNLLPSPGESSSATLMVTTTSAIRVLYGNDASDWNLVTLSHDTGAYRNALVAVGAGFALSRRGVVAINPSQTFGNFNVSAFSQSIERLLSTLAPQVRGTTVSFARNQFVFHFAGGVALTSTVTSNGVAGFMPLRYGKSFICFWSSSLSNGDDMILAGGNDGYVYRLNVGTSFDGDPIEARLWLAHANLGSPRNRKRFRKAVVEATAERYAQFLLRASYAYGDEHIALFEEQTARNIAPGFAQWDQTQWDDFFFDGRPVDPVEIKLEGSGESLGLQFASRTDLAQRFALHGVIVHFDLRRMIR